MAPNPSTRSIGIAQWLLVIDDYVKSHQNDIGRILPNKDIGHVLVTTRNPGASIGDAIEVSESIGVDDGVRLLEKSAGKPCLFIARVQCFRIADNLRQWCERNSRNSWKVTPCTPSSRAVLAQERDAPEDYARQLERIFRTY